MPKELLQLSAPHIAGNAWKYVKDCLDTEWVSSAGAYVGRFEDSVVRFTGASHAVAGVNGTACLHASLLAVGVRPGDAVLVPALTFIATANAVRYCGALPVFVDCEPDRYNLDLDALERFLDESCRRTARGLVLKKGGAPVKAVVPVHTLGYPVDMPRLMRVAARRRLAVVEDAAESIGSTLDGRHTGTFGRVGVLSFNGNKVVTCGGGGMMLTADGKLAARLRHVTQQAKADPAEYVHDEIGYNYRITNLAAALGLSQIELLPSFLRKREKIAAWYRSMLPGIPIRPVPAGTYWNRWLMGVAVDSPRHKAEVLRRLHAAGCQARPLWVPVPEQAPYRGSGAFPRARRAYETVVNIPSATGLTEAGAARVAKVLAKTGAAELLI
jgi:perosamine synthetase